MKMENKNLNIPNVTIGELVEMLAAHYGNAVEKGTPFKKLFTPFLWGPAGVGKSRAIHQLADRLRETTGKRVFITDVRLLLFNPVDLRGMPTTNAEKTAAVWLKPKIFQMEEGEDVINILFLDELSASPPSILSAAYQITLDRAVGEHKLPENCIVIAAGNRTTDQGISFRMPKPLCNRMMHFNMETNYQSWLRWALSEGIDSRIIGYLAFDNSKLCIEPETSDLAYSTPRSWEAVHHIIRDREGDLDSLHLMISACVGVDTALEFESWVKAHEDLPAVEEVLKGACTKYPSSYDALIAFTASLTAAARSRAEQISCGELENICAYISRFPADFAMTFYSDLHKEASLRLKLMKCPSCQRWLEKNKRYL